MIRPRYLNAAVAHLRVAEPVLGAVVDRVGACGLRRHADPFFSLVGTVISQQISTKAAASMRNRLVERFRRTGLTPQAILRAGMKPLQSCGLSATKAKSLLALSARIRDGEIDLARLPRQSDDTIAAALLPTHGIGPWSVHMFLMFGLARPDILPTGDYGLRVAIKNCFGLKELPIPPTIERLAEPWRPFRTVASWYLWRSLGNG